MTRTNSLIGSKGFNKSVQEKKKQLGEFFKLKRLKFEWFDFKESYTVTNKRDEKLGDVSYYKLFKCFVWEQCKDIIMSDDCLEEVIDFMKNYAKRKN